MSAATTSPAIPAKRLLLLAAAAFCAIAAIFLAGSLTPKAEAVPIYAFETTTTSEQAGAHPDISVRMEVGTLATEGPAACFCNAIKDLKVNMPAGFVGVPANVPQCDTAEFATGGCPADTQVGVVSVRLFGPVADGGSYWVQPLYNMRPRPGDLALLATPAPLVQTPIFTIVSSRTESDYGLEFNTFALPRLVPPNEITQFVWGVPADEAHDGLRYPQDSQTKTTSCSDSPLAALAEGRFPPELCLPFSTPPPTPANAPEAPFLINPTTCTGQTSATLEASSYDKDIQHASDPFGTFTGCDQLGFNPSLSAAPTTPEADAPSGMNVTLEVPQPQSPSTLAPTQIRTTRVSLPPGMTINANAADGKAGCTNAQAQIGTRDQAECPEFAKIGDLTIRSGTLPGPLPGAIYLGQPLPGERYRVIAVADGFSLHIKMIGVIEADPATGRLVITFDDLPQTPFEVFEMHFFGAERGMLATPEHCGTYAVESEFVPWNDELPSQGSTQFFQITSGPGGTPCPPEARPFAPGFAAGVTDPTGGAHTRFTMRLTRPDGNQGLSSLSVATPPGFSARLAGIPYCSDAALAAAAAPGYSGLLEQAMGSCPAASQVGTANAVAGAGTRPVSLPSKVYLAGPYKGAPLSLAVVTPAVSGPYDLGTVVIRVALRLDPTDAHISAISDELPRIIEGIPLRLREILLELDRPRFALNPTDCSPFQVTGQAFGSQGAVATMSRHFQVANCGVLDFSPRLALRLRGSVKRNGFPGLQAVLRAAPGSANIGRAVVTLPPTTLLEQSHIGRPCTRAEFAADDCPASARYGTAVAHTPLLDRPLRGPVYLRTSGGRGLPDLVADLEGQVDVELVGRIDTVRQALRTTFASVPDVPVSRFTLRMAGGQKSLIVNTENACRKPARARVVMVGQNGRRTAGRVPLRASCGKKRKQTKRVAHARRGRAALSRVGRPAGR